MSEEEPGAEIYFYFVGGVGMFISLLFGLLITAKILTEMFGDWVVIPLVAAISVFLIAVGYVIDKWW